MLNNKNSGMTLIEVVVTIAIVGILASIAVPSFLSIIQKNKKSTLRDELISALQLTRSTATISRMPITICGSNSSSTECSGSSSDWGEGWIIFTDNDDDGAIDSSEKIISIKNGISSGLSFNSTTSHITYSSQGIADGYKASFELCDNSSSNDDTVFGVYVSNFGYIREASSTDDSIGCHEP